jgi:predicted  nucleic acid-binding Zn-ribbon protein
MEADRWIDRVRSQRSHLPEMIELDSLESELRGLVKALQEAQAAQAPVRAAYEDAKGEAERLQVRAVDLETKLSASTASARELAAIQKELDHVRELLGAAEDRELRFLLEVEPLDDVVAAVKARAQPGIARRAQLQALIAELQGSLDEELVSLGVERDQRARVLSSDVLGRYDAALVRSGTSGAAQVDAGRCDGCRIALSPLDFDRWKAQAAGSFLPCPECGRLLLP